MINQGEGISRTFFIAISSLAFLGLYAASLYSYLLFHSLVEMFCIIVACGIFIVAWNSQKFLKNHYLLFLGSAFPFIALVDIVHTFSYGEMNVFKGYSSNLPTQLWITARYLQSITFFIAPFFVFRRVNIRGTVLVFMTVTAGLLISIFTGLFPDCYVEGSGLTQFKIISEYLISTILAGSAYMLYRKKNGFDPFIYRLLVSSIILTILSELAFTFYVSVYGLSNLVGHYLKLVAFYLIYKALIETGLREPYNLLFREIKESEESLNIALGETKARRAETSALLKASRAVLEHNDFRDAAREIFDACSELIGASAGYIALQSKDKSRNEVIFLEAGGLPCTVDTSLPMPIRGLRAEAYRSGKTVYDNSFSKSKWTEFLPEGHMELRNVLFAPMVVEGETVGLLGIANKPADFTDNDARMASAFGEIAAVAFRNTRQRETIEASEAKYRSLFENMIEGFAYHRIIQDETGKPVDYVFLEANEAFEHLTGLKRETLIGKPVTKVLPNIEKDSTDWIGIYGKVALSDEEIRFEQYSQALGKWFSVSAYSPEREYFVTVFEDITARKEAEHAVKESEKKYRDLAENSLVGIFKTNVAGDILYVNEAMSRIMEFDSPKEMISQGVVARYRDPADRKRLIDVLAKEGSVENFETVILTKRGKAINVLFNASIEGNVISGMLMDITERKRAEEELKWELSLRKAIADMSSLLINPAFSLDEAAEITREYALSLTESEHGLVTSIDPVTGDNVAHTLTPMMNWQVIAADKKISFPKGNDGHYPGLLGHALNTGKAFYTNSPVEHETFRGLPEGHKPIKNFLTAPASFGNKLMGQIAVSNSKHDYTDRDLYAVERLSELYALAVQQKRVEQELRNSLHEKEMLIKEIHHRMKNNLIVVTSLLKLQSLQVKDKETKELFKTSQNRVRSMSMIHERLYGSTDLASIDFGEYLNSLAIQLFHAYEINSSKVKLKVSADDARLDIDTVIPCGLMVNELISNALKYAFPGGREGTLRVDLHKADNDTYTLSVKDDGIGMSPDIDIHKTSSLGMQLVTSLAKQINGNLEVLSSCGTEFRVTFKERRFETSASDKKYPTAGRR